MTFCGEQLSGDGLPFAGYQRQQDGRASVALLNNVGNLLDPVRQHDVAKVIVAFRAPEVKLVAIGEHMRSLCDLKYRFDADALLPDVAIPFRHGALPD